MTPRTVLSRLPLGLAVLAGTLSLAHHRYQLDPTVIEGAIRNPGVWGPMVHVAVFALGTVVPGALFDLAGSVPFGPVSGTILNLAGATAAFLVARDMVDWVRRKAGRRLERLIKWVEAEGWRFVACVRLVPILPFNLLNYALARVRLADYVLASFVCMLPGTLAYAYAYLGYAGREALSGGEELMRRALVAPAPLAAAVDLPRLVRRLRANSLKRFAFEGN